MMNDTESKGLIPEAMAREYERLEAEEKGRTAAEQADAKGRRGKMAAYEWGVECERLAMEHLVREGYAIREMRWSPGAGKYEIDIIAELPGVIVFVEVKGRRPYEGQTREQWAADPVSPAAFVDLKKMKMLTRCADTYLRLQNKDYDYRFDIITLLGTDDDYILTHITDAFLPPILTR